MTETQVRWTYEDSIEALKALRDFNLDTVKSILDCIRDRTVYAVIQQIREDSHEND